MGRGGSGSRITMAAIGKLAGVSQVTVSRALSHPEKVSPDTLKRIREAIEVTGFVPNALAGALSSRRTQLITALIPTMTNIVYASLLHSFSDIMRSYGYQIMLSETGFDPDMEEQLVATLLSRRPDGILLWGLQHTASTRRMLLNADIPVVEVWDLTETPIDCSVGFSQFDAGQAVARFAHERGYRRAATVNTSDVRTLTRRDGFISRFTELSGMPVLSIDTPAGAPTLGQGRAALRELMDHRGFSDGVIFCGSDQFAHGLLIEAQTRGLRIPEDIAVVGFGDQDFAADTEPALTTVRVDRADLGDRAARALLERIEGTSDTPEAVIDVGFTLIPRGSA